MTEEQTVTPAEQQPDEQESDSGVKEALEPAHAPIPAPQADARKKHKASKRDFTYTQNRELSWLQFNKRVLMEALDESVPLYERMKFIEIFESNLDEFFMVRVGSLTDLALIAPEERENKANMTADEQLKAVFEAVRPLIKLRDEIYAKTTKRLAEYGVEELDLAKLPKKERKFARDYFRNYVQPVLSPQVIDERHPFPHLRSKELCVATLLSGEEDEELIGLIPIPETLPAWISDPENDLHYVRIEKLVAHYANKLFGNYEATEPVVVCVTRNADISFDEEKFADDEGDFRIHVSRLLKKRTRLQPVRLEVEGHAYPVIIEALIARLGLKTDQVYYSDSPLVLSGVYSFERNLTPALKAELCNTPFAARASTQFSSERGIIEQVMEGDRVLFYPYDSMEPFLRMLQEAATDPDVVSIKITVYRLASDSRVAQHLIEAAENGKDVGVLMELRARFDEANNIDWSQRLEEAGCNIIYGIENYKCHSKVCLITKRVNGRVINITQIGTGNYNEKTARLYTDICLFTADEAIGRDAVSFFQNLLVGNLNGAYESLLVAPASMKRTILSYIDREIAKGTAGRITVKCNALTERDIIDKLVDASNAGVQVRMNIRGISCLLPNIEGKSENIHIRSIVGRFLEHSRIYCFGTGDNMQMFISSADYMTRNLVHRVEVAAPINDPAVKQAIWTFLEKIFADNVKARALQADGEYVRVDESFDAEMFAGEEPFCLHDWCMENPLQAPIEVAPAKQRRAARVRRSTAAPATSGRAASGSGLPPIGQRTLWQRIKAVFLGD